MRVRSALFFLSIFGCLLLASSASFATIVVPPTTIVVTPGNMDGWTFYLTDANGNLNTGTGIGQMVNGPGTPPLGTGSANFSLLGGIGDQSVQLRNTGWAGTPMSSLIALSYSTYATAWNGQQLPWLTIYIDTTGDGSWDDRLRFEPAYSGPSAGNGNPNPQAGVALNVWQTWDALNGMWYDDNGLAGPGSNAKTLSALLALEPGTPTIVDAASGIGGIRIASGFASPANNFNAYVDNFTIGDETITYDFEVNGPAVPEPSSLLLLGTGISLVFVALRRRK